MVKFKENCELILLRVLVGSVPIQSITANIEYNKIHVYTTIWSFWI